MILILAVHKEFSTDTNETRSAHSLSASVIPTEENEKCYLYYGQYVRLKYYRKLQKTEKNEKVARMKS
jgi:hypothetical protein